MRRIVIPLEGTLATKSVKVHGGGVFARWIITEIKREAKALGTQILVLWPNSTIAQTCEEGRILSDPDLLIVECNSVSEFSFMRGDILFIPIMESAHINYKELKEKYPELAIRIVIHGVRNRDLLHYEKYQKYYHEWYKPYPGMGLLSFARQICASFQEVKAVRKACRYADMVFTDSNSSMERIIRYGKPRKIKYYHPSSVIPTKEPFAQADIPQISNAKYALLINGNRPEKNFLRTLVAFCEYKRQRPEDPLQLYAVGITDHIRKVIKYIRDVDASVVDREVKMFGYVTSEELAVLFRNCAFLVYPSRSEGYGLPLLDALNCGCPVVASRITSVPEVLGCAAYYVDPYSTQSILEGITFMSDAKNIQHYKEMMKKVAPMVRLRQEIDKQIFITDILDRV